MIYYDIQHHGNTERLRWLAGLLQDGSNILNFSLDISTDKMIAFQEWTRDNLLNASVTKSSPVTWCGPSQVTQMRSMLEKAIEVDGWEYFINLSGTCFPILSQGMLKKTLVSEAKKGYTSFCYGFEPKRERLWIENSQGRMDDRLQKINYLRLCLECSSDVVNAFEKEGFNPVRDVMHRQAVHCTEVAHEKRLILRGLEPWEIQVRRSFWDANPYVVGRAWVILHRKQVEWLLRNPLINELYYLSMNSFEPDESFFATLLFSKLNPYISEISTFNYRYKLGAPSVINEENIEDALKGTHFFARKLPLNASSSIQYKIEYLVHSSDGF